MDVRLPDGTIIRGVPDGTTREQVMEFARANGVKFEEPKAEKPESAIPHWARTAIRTATPAGLLTSLLSEEGRQDLGNAVAGGVRGAGSIGATLIRPFESGQQNEERRAAMDSALESMGADQQSFAYQGGKVTTEIGGTMGVGGAVTQAVGRVAPQLLQAAPRLVQAINSGGMTTGARVAPGVGAQATDLGIRAAGGAINGGMAAGMINPADAPIGVAVGGAIPVVTKAAGAAGHLVGNAVSPRMAHNNAVNKIGGALGNEAPQTIADIQTHMIRGAENVPLSAAAVTKNPKLAQLEQGSRLSSSPVWYEFDQRHGKAVFDNVMKATDEAGELGSRKGAREDNWQQAWEKAAEAQKPRVWQRRMTNFGAHLEQAMRSPQASNPDVRVVLEAINAEMDRVGPAFSPAHLQQIRANLNGKMQPGTNVFKSAPRDNPAIKDLISELDDILNVSTGGKWQKVLEGYTKDSESVRAAAAASKVRGSFVDGETGRVRGVSLDPNGDVAKVTEAGLGGAMDAARLPDKSLALSPQALNRLDATLEALRSQGMVQKLKRTSTAGGGSDTVSNEIAQGAAQKAGAPNMLLQLIDAARKMGAGKTENAMARLLMNPDELAIALETFGRPKTPNKLVSTLYRALPATSADR